MIELAAIKHYAFDNLYIQDTTQTNQVAPKLIERQHTFSRRLKLTESELKGNTINVTDMEIYPEVIRYVIPKTNMFPIINHGKYKHGEREAGKKYIYKYNTASANFDLLCSAKEFNKKVKTELEKTNIQIQTLEDLSGTKLDDLSLPKYSEFDGKYKLYIYDNEYIQLSRCTHIPTDYAIYYYVNDKLKELPYTNLIHRITFNCSHSYLPLPNNTYFCLSHKRNKKNQIIYHIQNNECILEKYIESLNELKKYSNPSFAIPDITKQLYIEAD